MPLLGMSPLLFLEFSQMWTRPHLQYFPISIAAFGYLVWQELPKPRFYAEGFRHNLALGCFSASIGVGLFGLWLYSPLLGLQSSVLAVAAWSFKSLPQTSLPRLLSLIAIIASCIPLPLNYDQQLVSRLQQTASRSCSFALDGLEVPHLLEGNIIQIADHPLFVEEACSGVTSLYSLLSLGIILAVINRRSWFVAIGTLAFIPFLAIATNLLRLMSIVLALYWWEIDLAHGYVHTILGLILFLIGGFALFCLDRLLATLFAPIPDDRSHAAILLSVYNNLVRWPYTSRSSRNSKVATNAIAAAEQTPGEKKSPSKQVEIPSWLKGLSPAIFVAMFAVSLTLLVSLGLNKQHVFEIPSISNELALEFPTEKALPESLIGQWQRVGFRTEKRERESVYGQRSHFWQYRDSDNVLILSLDFPFRAWHQLSHCYESSGWTVEKIETIKASESESWPWQEVAMSNGLGLKGTLLFCHFDEEGKPYIANALVTGEVESRANRTALQMLSASKDLREPITYQFQLFIESPKSPSPEELKKLREVFFIAREMVRQASLPVIAKVSE